MILKNIKLLCFFQACLLAINDTALQQNDSSLLNFDEAIHYQAGHDIGPGKVIHAEKTNFG